jgi:REP element-mobilizing transposase RayT
MKNASPIGSEIPGDWGEPGLDHHKDTPPVPTPITGKDTRDHQNDMEDLDPVTLSVSHLSYGCVLVPRLPQHRLMGDLGISLNNWVRQLALAFGWRLKYLAVHPDYLHWLAVVSPEVLPGQVIRDIRDHTSQRIFAEFPRLAQDNPSGDFWAPGYLIVNGRDALSDRVVDDFLEKLRFHQGAPRTRSGGSHY